MTRELLIVIVAACLFGLIAYRNSQIGSSSGTLAERLRSSGKANATSAQRRNVFVFEFVVGAIILIQSSASWPLKIGLFVALQVAAVACLAATKSFYEGS